MTNERLPKGIRRHQSGKYITDITINKIRETRVFETLEEAKHGRIALKAQIETALYMEKKKMSMTVYCENEQSLEVIEEIEQTNKQEQGVFTFPVTGQSVRIVVGPDGEPWFVARDVAVVLGYEDPAKAVQRHCKKVNDSNMGVSSRVPTPKIIPESDVFRLIMNSKLPSAVMFQDWVCEEVLPALRRTGHYSIPQPHHASASTPALPATDDAIIAQAMSILNTRLQESQQKALRYDHFLETNGTHSLTEAAKVLGMSGPKLGKILRYDLRWIADRTDIVHPLTATVQNGLMKMVSMKNVRGYLICQGRITPKGLDKLVDLFGTSNDGSIAMQ